MGGNFLHQAIRYEKSTKFCMVIKLGDTFEGSTKPLTLGWAPRGQQFLGPIRLLIPLTQKIYGLCTFRRKPHAKKSEIIWRCRRGKVDVNFSSSCVWERRHSISSLSSRNEQLFNPLTISIYNVGLLKCHHSPLDSQKIRWRMRLRQSRWPRL